MAEKKKEGWSNAGVALWFIGGWVASSMLSYWYYSRVITAIREEAGAQ